MFFSVSAFSATLTPKDNFVKLTISGQTLQFSCLIPDHNGGKWGCDTVTVTASHGADRADELVIRNMSVFKVVNGKKQYSTVKLYDLWTDDEVQFEMSSVLTPETGTLLMKDGQNDLQFEIWEDVVDGPGVRLEKIITEQIKLNVNIRNTY